MTTPDSFVPCCSIPTGCRESFAALDHPAFGPWQDLGVVRSGLGHLVDGYRITRPAPERLMVVATVAGTGFVRSEHDRQACLPGSILVAPPVSAIDFGCAGASWDIAWWYCLPDRRWPTAANCRPWPQARLVYEALSSLFDKTGPVHEKPHRAPPPRRRLRPGHDQTALLAELIASLLREQLLASQSLTTADGREQTLEYLLRDLIHEPTSAWPVSRAAAHLDCAPATLQRLVHRLYGCGWRKLLTRRQLDHAAQLLRHTDYPIAQIASLIGYADAFAFSTAFKRAYGLAPSHWRQSHQD